jgi:hypothetical protein
MQVEWHRHNSSPPSYPQSMQSQTPVSSTESLPAHNEELPSYQRVSRSRSAPPAYIQRQVTRHAQDHIIDLYSFPPRSTILVVGAYTRQGMHIIDRLIENGHSVRGIVSSAREAAQVSKHFEASHGRGYFHSSIVTDMTVEGALDSTARHCSGVVFVTSQSSPISMSTEERIANVLNALTSAVKEARMDRFVYCSSDSPSPVAAAAPQRSLNNQISTIDEEDDGEDDESVASLYHAISTTAAQQSPQPSRWLGSRSSSRSSSRNRNRSSEESSIAEETPLEVAIAKWVDRWGPKFALQTGKSLRT